MSDFFFSDSFLHTDFSITNLSENNTQWKGVLFFWRAIRELLLRRQRESAKQALYKREDFLSCHVPL